jgi:hypothetical protein
MISSMRIIPEFVEVYSLIGEESLTTGDWDRDTDLYSSFFILNRENN